LLDEDAVRCWLACDTSLDAIQAMLVPAEPGSLKTRAVSPRVNNPRHDGPQLIEAVAGT